MRTELEVGDVLASTHKSDVKHDKRQHRVVTQVEDDYVWLRTHGIGQLTGSWRSKRQPNGLPKQHRKLSIKADEMVSDWAKSIRIWL